VIFRTGFGRTDYCQIEAKEKKGVGGRGRKGGKEERKGKERKGGKERKERKGKERKGKERKGKERKGKERKGKERKGKERKKNILVLFGAGSGSSGAKISPETGSLTGREAGTPSIGSAT
jgi:hypothetical protein